ncbi:hypothetical protein D7X33_49900 [Butyricicoccus sp. 1XD8-22]|nr:hypothetical protein D7X33_49900 [Butyricicoccus sp. 1XD8-22]
MLAGPFPINQGLIMEYLLIHVSTEEEALNCALRMPVPKLDGQYEIEMRKLQEKSEPIQDPRIKEIEWSLQDQLNMLKNW